MRTPKRTLTGLSAILAIYSLSFLIVRWQFHSSSSLFIPTDTGYSGPVHHEHTSFWIPYGGVQRQFKQALYWGFFPAGRIDHMFTGRLYDRTDARVVIH
jgi:hypothetical protein